MAVDESHHMDRRGFLTTASKTALMGTGLLAAGWPERAAAAPAATPGAATPRAAAPRALAAGEAKTGQIEANGLRFSYVELGAGPLALCLHGWPDSPHTYRYLMPALAEAGYRAVVPYMRGYHPTEVPPSYTTTNDLAHDVAGLRNALGGKGDSVLIAHDWGAVATYGGAALEPDGWRRCVIMNVPPLAVDAQMMFRYDNLKREFYWWFFQQQISNQVVAMNDFAFIDGIWNDWSPGYDASEDLPHAKDCFRDPRHLDTTLGYYRAFFDPKRFATPEAAAEQAAVWGKPIPQRSLYMHGAQDGLFPMDEQELNAVLPFLGPGSEVAMIPGVGHFMLVEDPAAVNARILAFISG